MTAHRSLLMAGICLGLLSLPAFADIDTPSGTTSYYGNSEEMQAPAWVVDVTVASDETQPTVVAENEAPAAEVPATELGEAAHGVPGVTSYYGDTAPASAAAWAAEAAMNPDYDGVVAAAPATEAAPAADSAAAPADAVAEVPATPLGEAEHGVPGVTSYYGDTAPASTPAWAAEAAMNPDYSAEAPAAAAASAAEAPAVADVPATPLGEAEHGVPGVTSYYGDTAPASPPAWAAEAKMVTESAAASPATQQAVEACRDALNAEAKSGILFASNKWDVLRASYKTLDKLAKIASDCNANFVIEIGGHTDNVGTPAVNQQISELRAKAVLSYLTGKGVSASKLKAVGYGQVRPVADNATAEGRAKNRRIEFLVTAN